MTFAGRGLSVKPGLLSDGAELVLVLALLLLCTHSWGACISGTYNAGGDILNFCDNCDGMSQVSCPSFTIRYQNQFWTNPIKNIDSQCHLYGPNASCSSGYLYSSSYSCIYQTRCSSQAEADSAFCATNPSAQGCREEAVSPSCQADYQQCVGLGGVWKKISSTNSECASQCNTCENSAGTRFRNRQVDICCQQGLAPPDSAVQCYMPVNSGSGMTWSTRLTAQNDEGYSCGQLSTANGEAIQENQALYKRFCIDGDRYEEQSDTNDVGGSSSSGEGSSSSEGISSSFETELEALGGLYGVLDTIRDTLVKRLTPATEEIRDCLYNFKLCTALEPLQIDWSNMPQDTSIFNVDTAILKHIRPMMDSSVKLDSAQLKVLKQIDSLYKRGLVNDTDIVQAVNAIKVDINDVESAVRGVKHGVDSLIDSMTTYMDKVGQGIGAVGDSVGELRGMLQGYLDGVAPDDTNGDGYYGDYIGGSDTMGSGYLGGVFGGIVEEGSHDSNFTGIFDTTGFMSDSLLADSIGKLPSLDSMKAVLDSSVEADYTRLADTLQAAFDTLKDEIMLINFDSLILQPLGAKVPNTNTCPEHCFTFSVSNSSGQAGSWMGSVGTLTFPLCSNLPGMNFDVFVLIRVIARLVVAIGCIYIGIWFISGRKI